MRRSDFWTTVIVLSLGFPLFLSPSSAAAAGSREQEAEAPERQEEEQEGEAEEADAESSPALEDLRFEETVVVSASRIEQEIVNAPAAIAVLDTDLIENQASDSLGDLIRQAPGVSVTQMSNRDISVQSRGTAATLETSQLVLVDGRSVYQDFFGFVAWDLISVGVEDLDRVEVVNGPSSAVWGANAMSGVVNLITRSPRDNPGTTLDLRFGMFDRNVPGREMDGGTNFTTTLTHSQILSDTLAYRLKVGYAAYDAFARPQGEIPDSDGVMYPGVEPLDSRNPKVDFRLDWDAPDQSSGLRFTGGYAASSGMLHSGLGPFEIQPGTFMGYGRVQYLRGNMEVGAFLNSTRAEYNTLLTLDPQGQSIYSDLSTDVYDLSLRDTRFLGERNILTYGGNLRIVTMDFGLAPNGDGRNEQGLFVSDEIFLNDRLRLIVGARADRISTLNEIEISPRTTVIVKPTPRHSLRASWNRAYRAPSLSNTFLYAPVSTDIEIDLRPAFRSFFPTLRVPDSALPAPVQYRLPFTATGSDILEPERLTAYEIGWSGAITDWLGASAAWYRNDRRGGIDFTDDTFWSGADPPEGWREAASEVSEFVATLGAVLPPGTLPPAVEAVGQDPAYLIDLLAVLADTYLPQSLTYVNRDLIRQSGIEVGLNARRGRYSGYLNYSWQAAPEVEGFEADDIEEIGSAPPHRINAGLTADFDPVEIGASVNYSDRAEFTDVLWFIGWTEPYTMVNGSISLNLSEGRIRPSLRVVNLLNQNIQQHIFGDVLKRQIIGQIRYRF